MIRHLLDVADLSAAEVGRVLELARLPLGELGSPLAADGVRRSVGLIFEKQSLRTRHSMEVAVVQLGGHPVTARGEEISLDQRESVEDVTRILCGYHAVLGARVFSHRVVERMAAVADRPVINMLSDHAHPLQAFADMLTMEDALGSLGGRAVAWVGDYNNVARSLAEIGALRGAGLRFACPHGYGPDEAERERLALLGAPEVIVTTRPGDAVAGADAVHTDTWVSMGDEASVGTRTKAFEGFMVTEQLLAGAARHAVFLHCLPAHRGLEVEAAVIDGPRSLVFAQGRNRLDAARGVLAFVLEQGDVT